jgi:glycosyltransferase involved in cell wall biosynthesis
MRSTVKPATTKNNQRGHIFQITDNHSSSHPGVTAVVTQLTQYLNIQGWPTTILAAGVAATPVPAGVELVEFPLLFGGKIWRYPLNFVPYLEKLTCQTGCVLHIHGIWAAPQWLAVRTAKRGNIPVLLTAHDMLSPWHWRQSLPKQIKKLTYWNLVAYPAFRKLSIIHALTKNERDSIKKYFPKNRIEIIPNALDLDQINNFIETSQAESIEYVNEPYILFLGRIHPQKGVDILINAFAKSVHNKRFSLLIAGPDSSIAYSNRLKTIVRELKMEKKIFFIGSIYGNQKWRLLSKAWACCLPSRSEGMSIVSLEVGAAATPLITTYEAGILEWEKAGGILIHPQVEELSKAFEQVLSWTEEEQKDRGRRLRSLVESHFSWQVVGPQWMDIYDSLLS